MLHSFEFASYTVTWGLVEVSLVISEIIDDVSILSYLSIEWAGIQ